jgi:hypothetical protein
MLAASTAAITAAASALPSVESASQPALLQAGDTAPDFTLADSMGNPVRLSNIVSQPQSTVLIFYLSHT